MNSRTNLITRVDRRYSRRTDGRTKQLPNCVSRGRLSFSFARIELDKLVPVFWYLQLLPKDPRETLARFVGGGDWNICDDLLGSRE